jgi:hypothetical protein
MGRPPCAGCTCCVRQPVVLRWRPSDDLEALRAFHRSRSGPHQGPHRNLAGRSVVEERRRTKLAGDRPRQR